MGETGVLDPEARCELIECELFDMSPIGPPHSSKVNRLNRLFSRTIGDQAIVSAQNPTVLGDLSAPQPDLALLRWRQDFYEQAHPGPEDILVLVEVADSWPTTVIASSPSIPTLQSRRSGSLMWRTRH